MAPTADTSLVVLGPAWAKKPTPELSQDHYAAFERLIASVGDVAGEAFEHVTELAAKPLASKRLGGMPFLRPIGLSPRVNWPGGSTKKCTQEWRTIVIASKRYYMIEGWRRSGRQMVHGDPLWEISSALMAQTSSWRARLGLWRRLLAIRSWCIDVAGTTEWDEIERLVSAGPRLPPRPRTSGDAALGALEAEIALLVLE